MGNEQKFFYANAVEVTVSPFDVSLNFIRTGAPKADTAAPKVVGELIEGTAAALDTLVVSMSPMHAKAMLMPLVALVRKYEESFGVLPMPPEAQAQFVKLFGGGK